MMRNYYQHFLSLLAAVSVLALSTVGGLADGIYRNGIGARAMALGGADTAWAEDPLGALGANPAGLGFQSTSGLNLGLGGASANGKFTKDNTSDGGLNSSPSFFPDAAGAYHLGDSRFTIGLAFIPDALMSADWHYVDPPGGLGNISYGDQQDRSVITVLRTALGFGAQLSDQWSVGGSVGVLYNKNSLKAPYIFQSQPGLAGAKTLLDLNTDGWGLNYQIGALFRPIDTLQFGLAYTTGSTVDSHGDATGDASVQFGAPVTFHYDAEVRNKFPQMVSGGVSWKFQPRWRAIGQIDWIGWADAFKTLTVNLSNGSNPGVPSPLQDNIPLNWNDEFVYRAGLEFNATEKLILRGGYSYGASPVPDSTLSPLTAVIMEHTITAGAAYHWDRYQIDLACQYDLPKTRDVGTSGLLSGEYSNSSTKVSILWFALTAGMKF
jgi:long-chain fatty acid transport protein